MRRLVKLGCIVLCCGGLLTLGCTGRVGTGGGNGSGSGGSGSGTGGDSGLDVFGGDGGTGDAGPSNPWADSDKDGYLDRFDNCPKKSNPKQKDQDGDGVGDPCDNHPRCANKDQKDKPCNAENSYDPKRDTDGDGVPDAKDNCRKKPNKKQADSDADGTGDACETPPDKKFGSGTDSDGDGLSDKKEKKIGTNPNKADTDGDGTPDGVEVAVGTDPTSADKACATKKEKAEFQPIDIIFAIDTSGSMGQEISGVERNINQNFTNIITSSGVDYRVILLADKDHVCVQQPLGTGNCGDGASTNTMRFKHIDQAHDGGKVSEQNWLNFIEYYDGTRAPSFGTGGQSGEPYNKYLRNNSFKVLVAISDENEQVEQEWSGTLPANPGPQDKAQEFDKRLTAKSNMHFGTPSNRNYRFHAIVGVPPKGPMNRQAWQPSEPVQDQRCSGNGNSAQANPEDEHAAIMTGGLRYPVCETPSYDAVFKQLAKGVVGLACAVDLPKTSGGKKLDEDKVGLEWTPQGGSSTTLTKVHDKSNCGKNHFYVNSMGKVQLCKSSCNKIKKKTGTLKVYAGCCNESEEICDYKDNDCDGDVDENCSGCTPEICTDDKDNDCDGKVNEGCCMKKKEGEKCSKDKECCSGNCRSDGKCGAPCRPIGVSCVSNSQCCSDLCAGNSGNSLGSCDSP